MRRNISKRSVPRQIFIVFTCAIIMLVTGNNLLKIESIQTILDGLSAMIFFICFFPFGFHLVSLLKKCIKSLFKILPHLPFF